MEHPCERCQTPVEDGVSFCPACGAPQIRVTIAAIEPASPAAESAIVPAGAIDWSRALPAAASTGAVMAVLCILSAPILRAGFLIWIVIGGGMCVAMYRRRKPEATVTGGTGARLGAVSGFCGFGLFALVQSGLLWLARGEELRQSLRQMVQQAAAQNPDPAAKEMMQRFTTPEGLALLLTLTMVAFLVMFVMFGALGGTIAASFSRRKPKT